MKTSTYFGDYGGVFVSELFIPALEELEQSFLKLKKNKKFIQEMQHLLKDYAGRPTPLYFAKNLSKKFGCKIYLKREDLLHGGAHKTNNTIGQGLLAKHMGKKELIAETGAGQHGAAVAMIGALLGLPTKVFMGAKDVARQAPNVMRMRMCGAQVIPVRSGSETLKDAINDAMRYWVSNLKDTFYVFGTAAGPHPYPAIVEHFQKVIGQEARKQILKQEGSLPKAIIACVGGGSNAIGIFNPFIKDKSVELIGVEPAGHGLNTKKHGAPLTKGRPGVLHGSKSYVMQNKDGQIQEAHSLSAGLDYPGVGPKHSYLKDIGRARYSAVTDKEAVDALLLLCSEEGIIPALESSHALAYAQKYAKTCKKNDVIIVNLSGRGDKDLNHINEYLSS